MLIEFSVSNFLSFKDKITFSMLKAPLREKYPLLENNHFSLDKNTKLLKSASVYGANASGKSNLIKSIAFFIRTIIESKFFTEKDIISVQPFLLSKETKEIPSFFEIVIHKNSTYYRYGFELTYNEIIKEWLFVKKSRETKVFYRNGMSFDIVDQYKVMNELKTRKMIPKNSLMISKSAQFNEQISNDFLNALSDIQIISAINDELYSDYTIQSLDNPKVKNKIFELLNFADFSIENIEKIVIDGETISVQADIVDINNNQIKRERKKLADVNFLKNVYDENKEVVGSQSFNVHYQESQGTQKFFHIAGPILDCLTKGYTLVVDELDTKLHPLLVRKIVELFHNPSSNIKNAQLIFTTHNTALFNSRIFRRDQIWLTDKNKYGSSDLFSLADFERENKKVRNDEAYERNYLLGKYRAVPFLGRFEDFTTNISET